MKRYRVGRSWGVTIVEMSGGCWASNCTEHEPPSERLVAVVVDGGQALAEQICEVLNDAEIRKEQRERRAGE